MKSLLNRIFFSVYTLKSIISIGTVVTLLIGIALLFILVYAFIISSVTAQIQSNFRNWFVGLFLLSSLLMILSSITAIYGLIRKKNKFLVFYAIAIGIYFVSFIGLGVFSKDLPKQLEYECATNPRSSSFHVAMQTANNTLCKKQCACYFPKFIEYNQQNQQIIKRMGAQNFSQDQNQAVSAQQCENWSNSTSTQTQQLLMIQSFFSCSGWCNVDPKFNLYYLFSDINRGIPEKGCIQALIQFFQQFGDILQISSFTVSVIVFVILLNILCLCFHPNKSREYDALKFFRQTLIHKNLLNQEKEGIQIQQIEERVQRG